MMFIEVVPMKRIVLLFFVISLAANAVAREVYDINRGWKFFTYNEGDSFVVNLPHTWNKDALGGRRDYYRGTGNYLKYIDIKPEWRHRRIFIRFYGGNAVTDLMINGRLAGEHKGGNNAFVFEITDYVDFSGKNLFWVVVNNSARTDILPTAGTENNYGGLYRGAELIVTGDVALGLDSFGSDGIMFRTSKADEEKAEGTVNVRLNSSLPRSVNLSLKITDAGGRVVAQANSHPKVEKGVTEVKIPFEIDKPVLWNGTDDPYLYNVTVTAGEGVAADAVTVRTGVRTFSADASKGFFLNGKPYPLRAVVLYRDRATYGPVSFEAQLREDIDVICEMGANAVRVAEGIHSQEFYRLCDERGLIVLSDAPFVGAMSLGSKGFYDTKDFRENGKQQLKEMIYQLYNNPSVMIWGIFSHPELRGDNPIPYIKELNSVAKTLDPSRLTAGISNRDGDVNAITDLIIWSHTFGWVSGNPSDIGIWRDQLHSDKTWNKTRSAVGWLCGGSVYHQDENLSRTVIQSNWHPENWQAHLHEVYLGLLDTDDKFWGLFAGNMFDYGSVHYLWGEGNGINDCGLVTHDRQTRKDAFYVFKANWNKKNHFVHIAGKRMDARSDIKQSVTVYSNLDEVELAVNGYSCGAVKGTNGVFTWENVELIPGNNHFLAWGTAADGSEREDKASVRLAPSLGFGRGR